jgi:hypothetical protein
LEGDWNNLMSELTTESDSTGGENKKKDLVQTYLKYV